MKKGRSLFILCYTFISRRGAARTNETFKLSGKEKTIRRKHDDEDSLIVDALLQYIHNPTMTMEACEGKILSFDFHRFYSLRMAYFGQF